MYKICLTIVALAFVGLVSAQQNVGARPEESGAAEPYSYGYETDTHSAAEQRDPNGAVTGYYTLTDADGRQRRVEYVADESGFRAKVQTNEMGTKSHNSADVEVVAQPPTAEQLVYQAQPQQQQQQQQFVQVQRQQSISVPQQQQQRTQQVVSQEYYQPGYTNYGYYPGASYGGYSTNYAYPGYGMNTGYYQPGMYGYTNQGTYSSYNNHLPSSYYRAMGMNMGRQQQQSGASRYVTTTTTTSNSGSQPVAGAVQTAGGYRSYQTAGGYQTVGVPQYQTSYQTVPVQGGVQGRSASLSGSSNYIVLKKKREDGVASDEKKNN